MYPGYARRDHLCRACNLTNLRSMVASRPPNIGSPFYSLEPVSLSCTGLNNPQPLRIAGNGNATVAGWEDLTTFRSILASCASIAEVDDLVANVLQG